MDKSQFLGKSPNKLSMLKEAYEMSILAHENNVEQANKIIDEMIFWRQQTKHRLRSMEFAYGDLCETMIDMGLETHGKPSSRYDDWSIEDMVKELGLES